MGLPEKIKNTLTGSKTPATRAPTTVANKPAAPAKKHRNAAEHGLPAFRMPELPAGHRALLIACARTGRASWAVLRSDAASAAGARSWRFIRNIPAVPANSASGAAANTATSRRAATAASDSNPSSEIAVEDVDFEGFACGICGDAGEDAILIRCGPCGTMQCKPGSSWQCPGCGARLGDTNVKDMDSLQSQEGQAPSRARAGLSPSGSGPDGKKAIKQSQAIPASSGREGSRGS